MKKSLKYGIATAVAISAMAAAGYIMHDASVGEVYGAPPPDEPTLENYEDSMDFGYIEDIIQNI